MRAGRLAAGVARTQDVATGSVYDRGERIRVKGLDTWVVRAGPRGGTPVVFLHGIPTSAYVYRDVMRAMHEERDCIAFDWPGYGSSQAPHDGGQTHRARATHLEALLDALGLERVHLVVHDMGGPAGLLFAVEHPGRVEKLIVLNTTVYKSDYHPPLPALAQFVPVVRELTRPLFTQRLVAVFMKRGLARPERMARTTLDNHARLASAPAARRAILDSWAQMPEGAEDIRRIRERMPSYQGEVLVLFGAEDPFLPPRNAERLAKDFPNATLQLLPKAGHFLQEDAPEIVADRIAAFIG